MLMPYCTKFNLRVTEFGLPNYIDSNSYAEEGFSKIRRRVTIRNSEYSLRLFPTGKSVDGCNNAAVLHSLGRSTERVQYYGRCTLKQDNFLGSVEFDKLVWNYIANIEKTKSRYRYMGNRWVQQEWQLPLLFSETMFLLAKDLRQNLLLQ